MNYGPALGNLPDLPLRLILHQLDLQDLIKCRLISKRFLWIVDQIKLDELLVTSKYFDPKARNGKVFFTSWTLTNELVSNGYSSYNLKLKFFNSPSFLNKFENSLAKLYLNEKELPAQFQIIEKFKNSLRQLKCHFFSRNSRELRLPHLQSIEIALESFSRLQLNAPNLKRIYSLSCLAGLELVHPESVDFLRLVSTKNHKLPNLGRLVNVEVFQYLDCVTHFSSFNGNYLNNLNVFAFEKLREFHYIIVTSLKTRRRFENHRRFPDLFMHDPLFPEDDAIDDDALFNRLIDEDGLIEELHFLNDRIVQLGNNVDRIHGRNQANNAAPPRPPRNRAPRNQLNDDRAARPENIDPWVLAADALHRVPLRNEMQPNEAAPPRPPRNPAPRNPAPRNQLNEPLAERPEDADPWLLAAEVVRRAPVVRRLPVRAAVMVPAAAVLINPAGAALPPVNANAPPVNQPNVNPNANMFRNRAAAAAAGQAPAQVNDFVVNINVFEQPFPNNRENPENSNRIVDRISNFMRRILDQRDELKRNSLSVFFLGINLKSKRFFDSIKFGLENQILLQYDNFPNLADNITYYNKIDYVKFADRFSPSLLDDFFTKFTNILSVKADKIQKPELFILLLKRCKNLCSLSIEYDAKHAPIYDQLPTICKSLRKIKLTESEIFFKSLDHSFLSRLGVWQINAGQFDFDLVLDNFKVSRSLKLCKFNYYKKTVKIAKTNAGLFYLECAQREPSVSPALKRDDKFVLRKRDVVFDEMKRWCDFLKFELVY